MQRICFVIPSLSIGGAEMSMVKMANILLKQGNQVCVITFSSGSYNELASQLQKRISVQAIGGLNSSDPRLWFRLRRMLKHLRPTVVIGWSLYANLVCCLVTRRSYEWLLVLSERIYLPMAFSSRKLGFVFKDRVTLLAVKYLYRRACLITTNSRMSLRFLRGYTGGNTEKFAFLPNVIDVDDAIKMSNMEVNVIPKVSGPHILAVGRLDYQKGFDILLRSFAEVRKKRQWNLVIVGDGPDSSFLKRLGQKLGIANVVHWVGKVDNPFPYYGWADMVLVPSRFEGFPNVPLEAMACGKAVICANCKTGPTELTMGGRFGKLVPVEDVLALADAMIALGDDQKLSAELGRVAQEHIRKNYDASNIISFLNRQLN